MTVQNLVESKRYGDLFILARYAYRIGTPIMDDKTYDGLEAVLKKKRYEVFREYFTRSYDDDPVPLRLLKELDIEPVPFGVSDDLRSALEDEKSNSIRAVRSWEQAYEFVQENWGQRFVISLKLDGVNSKLLYLEGKLELGISRGRKGNSIDYTQGIRHVVPRQLETPEEIKITGESYVVPEALEILRDKYSDKKYKTSKSAAISMLRVPHDSDDYKFVKFRAFHADGQFQSVIEMYEYLEARGFETPPYVTIDSFPSDKGEFRAYLERLLTQLFEQGEGFPSDGVVLEVDDLRNPFTEKNQYNNRQIALKFWQWDFGYEKGEIVDIKIEQRRVYKSVIITIKPIKTRDGCKAEHIQSYNPAILINNNLYVGKTVYFEKNSNAVNVLIYGKHLQHIMELESGI